MIDTKKKYSEYLKSINQELIKIKIHSPSTEKIIDALHNTELILPVIGAFSSGKSTLINSFLGQEYLPVGITPETALATELRYADKEFIEAIKADNTIDKYAISEMDIIKEKAKEYKFLKMYINNDKLRTISPLILVDMPGFDSPLDLHNQAIINYINRGVHYIVLTSVEDGNITRSMVRQLSDIQEFGRDFSFFLSKSNLKAESEIKEISEKISKQINEHFDISKTIVSIGTSGGESLEKVIKEIDPEKLFENLFIGELKQNYFDIVDNINTIVTALTRDKTENEQVILELKKGVETLIQKREKMLNEAKEKYSDINVNRIVDSTGRELSDSLNELVSSALTGGKDSLSQQITEIVRHSLIENVKRSMSEISNGIIDDFAFEIKDLNTTMSAFTMDTNWLEKVTDSTKNMFEKTNNFLSETISKRSNKNDPGKIYKAITTVLSVTTTVVSPILELVIIFLPEILSLIFGAVQKKKQEEQVRNHILTQVIPSIKRELRSKLPEIFNTQINILIKQVADEFEGLLQDKQNLIAKTEEEKMDMIKNIEDEIKNYNKTKEDITVLANQIIF